MVQSVLRRLDQLVPRQSALLASHGAPRLGSIEGCWRRRRRQQLELSADNRVRSGLQRRPQCVAVVDGRRRPRGVVRAGPPQLFPRGARLDCRAVPRATSRGHGGLVAHSARFPRHVPRRTVPRPPHRRRAPIRACVDKKLR